MSPESIRTMPYDSQHRAEIDRRKDRARRELVPLMNDTKWREVFLLNVRLGLRFQMAWIRDSEWKTSAIHHPVSAHLISCDGIKDPGVGGPCLYRDILWIRFPRVLPSEYWGPAEQSLQQLWAELVRIGMLPVRTTNDFVEIRGYDEPAT